MVWQLGEGGFFTRQLGRHGDGAHGEVAVSGLLRGSERLDDFVAVVAVEELGTVVVGDEVGLGGDLGQDVVAIVPLVLGVTGCAVDKVSPGHVDVGFGGVEIQRS